MPTQTSDLIVTGTSPFTETESPIFGPPVKMETFLPPSKRGRPRLYKEEEVAEVKRLTSYFHYYKNREAVIAKKRAYYKANRDKILLKKRFDYHAKKSAEKIQETAEQ